MKRIRPLLAPAAVAACLLFAGCTTPRCPVADVPVRVSAETALSLWNEDAPARAALVAYVEAVTDPNGAEVYAGGDKNEAIVAMVETLTNLPIPGQLIGGGVVLKKFKQYQKKLVMGKSAEGYALAPFKAALKSKKPAEVEEAQAILDSIEKAKGRLADDIKEDLAAGDKGMALRDIRWYITTWPSERKTYEEDFKRLSADPEAVKAEKAWFAAQKKRR